MRYAAPAALIATGAILLGGGYALASDSHGSPQTTQPATAGASSHHAIEVAHVRGEDNHGRHNEQGEARRHEDRGREHEAGDDRGRGRHHEDGKHRHGGDKGHGGSGSGESGDD